MTAELAVVLPAVLLVLAACLGALHAGMEQARVATAAAVASRSAARGDPASVAIERAVAAGAASVRLESRAGLICARATASVRLLGLPIPIMGTSCALAP